MSKPNNLQVKMLSDITASEDCFEDKTHSRIAETLYSMIQEENAEGLTIGVEGSWGSGKSTVISMLEHKLKLDPAVAYFYFDAWAHEGDPLRRVFLETILEQVANGNSELQTLQAEISNRVRKTVTTTNQTITGLGKLLALTALSVPLGAAIISDTAGKLTFDPKLDIFWIFILGVIAALLPIFPLIQHGRKLRSRDKSLSDIDNWAFMQGESTATTTQEISEGEERTSIEFERYFQKILQLLFEKTQIKKVVVVADNLDRVDAHDSLKIWSTLQTFLQRKGNNGSLYNKVWVLVPYDEEGLAKLWEGQSIPDGADRGCAKSFFDKCFQVRIKVPKLLLSGWESFCRECIDKCLVGLSEPDIREIINVLRWTRESVEDIPTPREIKNFVNQVGLLLLHSDESISVQAISFFSVHKYMKFKTSKDIECRLILGELPSELDMKVLSQNISAELCGILFSVSASKGQELLLEPVIERALITQDINQIQKLAMTHKAAFWTVMNFHLSSHAPNYDSLQSYCYTIEKGLLESYPEECKTFIKYVDGITRSQHRLEFPLREEGNKTAAMLVLLQFGGHDVKQVWEYLMTDMVQKINSTSTDISWVVTSLIIMATAFKTPPVKSMTDQINIDRWEVWAVASSASVKLISGLIMPKISLDSEISKKVVVGVKLSKELENLVKYLIQGGEKDWKHVISGIKAYIEHNNGNLNSEIFSPSLINILTDLSYSDKESLKLIESIVRSPQFYNMIFSNKISVKPAAILAAKVIACDLRKLQIPQVENSVNGLQLCQQFWNSVMPEDVNLVWEELFSRRDYLTIWNMAEDPANKLIGSIIEMALHQDVSVIFQQKQSLKKLCDAMALIDQKEYTRLAIAFVLNSQIETEVVESDELDICSYDEALFYLSEVSNKKELHTSLSNRLNYLPKTSWDKAFNEDTYLTSLALSISEKGVPLKLNNDYSESLIEFLSSCLSGTSTLDDWNKDDLPRLVSVLSESFKTKVSVSLANHLVQNGLKTTPKLLKEIHPFINMKKVVVHGKEQLQNLVEQGLRNQDWDVLKVIDIILSNDGGSFKPDPYLPEILSGPLNDLLNNLEDSQLVALAQRVATRFEVTILPIGAGELETSHEDVQEY